MLRSVLRKNSLDFTDEELDLLMKYVGLMIEWNKKINLISRKDEENILERHIIISLALLFRFEFSPGATVLDLGTGGGLPGIPLAILCRSNRFTLLDSTQKKITAVRVMIEGLPLPNAHPVAGRAEELAENPEFRGMFDYVISRAVSSITDVVRWSKPFLLPQEQSGRPHLPAPGIKQCIPRGSIVLYKGGDLSQELLEAKQKTKLTRVGVYPLVIDGINELHVHDKKLVIIQQ